MNSSASKLGFPKSLVVKSLIAVLGIVLLLWLLDESGSELAAAESPEALPQVSVLAVSPEHRVSEIKVTGIVKPRWPLTIVATVNGRLEQHFEQIQPGSFVSKGQIIATIQDIDYVSALADAQARVSQAKLNLARYLNEQSVAKQLEVNQVGNDFRLFKPHVSAAKAELAAAKASYQSALKRVNDTKIKAPFDAIVLAKHIAPAKEITQGDQLYQLASSQAIDVDVALAADQWQQIINRATTSDPLQANVTNHQGNTWQAEIRFLSPSLTPQTRQQSLRLTIANPYPENRNQLALSPAQQVSVSFTTAQHANTIIAPASVLTRDQQVWTVQNNKLVLEDIHLLNEAAGQILFTFHKQTLQQRQLVRYPLSTMLSGQTVEPLDVTEAQNVVTAVQNVDALAAAKVKGAL
ncbi:efflux RND transporter periplasmic adaptor subunit [Thalassotalea euphylliae]|uniref:Efflux RND transporter periplasmic adaptor subunit n=1 Tax=Thalassotalea euphylliae TaxID=1655234 RepID=A0A3E0TQJ0_9GAMM|nr:efflux RND transporter periplasmic adaptor subunit [Thalassotalea euphylliae]REL26225.1 efflux RND transporter periplasmic adaptor subunit [Thalassotalea euphylliae]